MAAYRVERLSGPALAAGGWIDAMLALERENLEPLLRTAGQPFPEARRREALASGDTLAVLLLRDGVLAGSIDFAPDWNDAADLYVASVQLRASARGGPALGVLLAAAFDAVCHAEWRRLTANVHPANHAALRLAGRLGFRRTAAPGRTSVGLALGRAELEASPFAALAARHLDPPTD
jgi:RimJ/RimL family protein N-acetyltransferase